MSFTQTFGGNTIYPSDISYLALSLTADTALQWPLEAAVGNNLVARIIDVTPSGAYSVFMPDATQTGVGQVTQFKNLGPSTITIKNYASGTLLSIAAGLTFTLYLTDNTTAAGTWNSFQAGASTAQAQASALAGYGLIAQGSVLSQSQTVTLFNSNYTLGPTDRAQAYVWTGGVGTLTLPTASSVGNNWFVSVRNGGTGDLTVARQGSDQINGSASLVLRPADSAMLLTDGINFFTVGYGQQAVFAFDYTSIDLTGQSSPYTLSGSQLNRVSYKFVGTLSSNMVIYVPATIQQYWIDNETTGGSYTLSVGTSTQVAPVTINRGARGIYYCDGTNVVNADTASISLPIAVSQGGTGATTSGGALINLGGTATGISVFQASSATLGRLALSAAASGANSDITSLSGLTTPLSVTQGGTGQSSYTDGQLLIGNSTGNTLTKASLTAGSGVTITPGSGSITISASGTGGTVISVSGSGGTTGLTLTGGPITGSGTLTLGGTLTVANGGTGATTLTGVLKGNGTSAFTAATAGTDYVAPGTPTTFTALQTFSGSTSSLATLLANVKETVTVSATAATGTINYDITTQSVQYYTTNASGNWALNLRANGSNTLRSLLGVGESVTVAFLVTQGSTAYYNNVVQVDGTATGVTTVWQGGAPTAGNASGLDVYTYTVIKTAATPTYTVLATQTQFK